MPVAGWSTHRDDAQMVYRFMYQETGEVWSVSMDHLWDIEPEELARWTPEVFTDFLGMYGQQVKAGKTPIPGLTVAKPVDKTEWEPGENLADHPLGQPQDRPDREQRHRASLGHQPAEMDQGSSWGHYP
jgi:hypothetical protein